MGNKKLSNLEKGHDILHHQVTGKELKMTRKQIRARQRRRMKQEALEEKALAKPIAEWDLEELAKGRPKNKNGNFQGRPPSFISRAMHEEISRQFVIRAKGELQSISVPALKVLLSVLENEDTTEDGKFVVPPSTKVDVAKFVIEQVIGKPTQKVEADISVRLQGILAQATGTAAADIIDVATIQQHTALSDKKTNKAVLAKIPGMRTEFDVDDTSEADLEGVDDE